MPDDELRRWKINLTNMGIVAVSTIYLSTRVLARKCRKTTRAIAHSIGSFRNLILGKLHDSSESSYCIASVYNHRDKPSYFDDTGYADQWQREVYLFARELLNRESLRTVYDVGCGSAYKLVNYLGEFDCTGFDVEQTVTFLRQKYPDHNWVSSNFSDRGIPPADLIICSDVIEHVADPDELVEFINSIGAKYVLFSTPDRDLTYPLGSPYYKGPPANTTHLREWSSRELNRYLSRSFDIIDHHISNWVQSTQMVLCVPKAKRDSISAVKNETRSCRVSEAG